MKVEYARLQRALASTTPGMLRAAPGCRQAAVCLPLFDRAQTLILLIQKSDNEGYHWRNQIALPGGHVDPTDRSVADTALREMNEELGIHGSELEVLGSLGHFQTRASNMDVSVTVARWHAETVPQADPREVARILEVPLAELVEAHVSQGLRSVSFGQLEGGLVYSVSGVAIWGVTARILHSFLELILNQ